MSLLAFHASVIYIYGRVNHLGMSTQPSTLHGRVEG